MHLILNKLGFEKAQNIYMKREREQEGDKFIIKKETNKNIPSWNENKLAIV